MEEKILKASATGYRPAVARLTTNHINGGVSFICDSLAGWSSKCSFVVYEVDSDGVPIAGTETDWIGSKVNNNLESLTLTAGTDRDYPANLTMIVADETAGGRNKLVEALTTTLEVDGTLKNSIVAEANIATGAVTNSKLATDAVETVNIKDANITEAKIAPGVAFLAAHPVGSIYLSVDSTNPSVAYGGTWSLWGAGRVPVGVDTTQTEFNTVEKTGGSKYLQQHKHNLNFRYGNDPASTSIETAMYGNVLTGSAVTPRGNTPNSILETGTGDSQNLQPYITCYMFKRVS